MNRLLRVLLLVSVSLLACSKPGPEISVEALQIVSPAPGRTASVAYMILNNRGDSPAVLTRISSEQFATVELHETILMDGIAKMQALDYVSIEANDHIDFAPGGKHVMLFKPAQAWAPGKSISLQLHFESGAILLVSAPISTRIDVE